MPALPHFKEITMPAQYHISLPDPSKARGNDPDLSFHSQGAAGFAEELQDAIRRAPPALPKNCRTPCAAARCSSAGKPSNPIRMQWSRSGA